jgi:hypothetical protein
MIGIVEVDPNRRCDRQRPSFAHPADGTDGLTQDSGDGNCTGAIRVERARP